MSSDVAKWARHCVALQKTKIYHYARALLSSFRELSHLFVHIHNLSGHFPQWNDYTNCLITINDFTDGKSFNYSRINQLRLKLKPCESCFLEILQ
ncbi:hypothetical protein CEXT_153601 [Caerostris extrusa]|uniref:4a-hydroxytetrahydrobiopterin dehydratase n=1 Tax=Caerostris extrusa TaxID=172846 RepID=A0AAV4RWT5_CAEEX|nr:hypothetical protein CEXT_153601 [Caerostris extrusa]